ncbi:hypothetical protein C6341_g8566 [Phytophthora cactorum]|nr:hypothetical protein C6341_g8566 [Phytophthora cactorum]
MIAFDFGVSLSTSMISQKLCGKLYTMKQVTNEPVTCNSGKNIGQRRVFAKALLNDCKGGRCGNTTVVQGQ